MAKKQASSADVPFDAAIVRAALEKALADGIGRKLSKVEELNQSVGELVVTLCNRGASNSAISKIINESGGGNATEANIRDVLALHGINKDTKKMQKLERQKPEAPKAVAPIAPVLATAAKK